MKLSAQANIHVLYTRALDQRLCAIMGRLGACVSPVSTPARLLGKLGTGRSGIVLVDVDTELDTGIALVRSLAPQLEHIPLVPLCMQGSIAFFRACFQAGASDVLDKSFDDGQIAAALGAAIDAGRRQPESVDRRRHRLRFALLTRREREIFRHVTDGHTNQDIADLLALSRRTVEVHRANIQRKLRVRNVAQMASVYAGFARYGAHQ